jgi:hypothetical protein
LWGGCGRGQATCTHWAESDGGSGQAYEASVARMGLVDRISIFVAELVEDGQDAVMVLGGNQLADGALEPMRGFRRRMRQRPRLREGGKGDEARKG